MIFNVRYRRNGVRGKKNMAHITPVEPKTFERVDYMLAGSATSIRVIFSRCVYFLISIALGRV